MAGADRPPAGTIALLFTDIEGSTRLATALGSRWPAVLANHHALVGGAIAAEGGYVDGTAGDAFFATFVDAQAAAHAGVAALRAVSAHPWPAEIGALGVRMGLHVGFVEHGATGYVGLEVHRAARVADAAHGGQLLLTPAARALVGDSIQTESLGTHRLKDFPTPEQLFCAVVDGRGAAAFPPPRTHQVRPTNLPAGLPALVGREENLEGIRDALLHDGDRLVTLTGRGGVGKTSLALVAASGMLDDHPGGVWLVSLAAASSSAEVLPAVASAIGADLDRPDPALEAIVERLRDRGPTLLVLDNLERLLAAGPTLTSLLDALPDLRLVVTSQAPLRLASERCLLVDALDDDAALALIERVTQKRGAKISTHRSDREALLTVIRLLDGLPLALELVAARLAVLSPAQLRDRLPESPELVRDTAADRPERQRSLSATVDWTLSSLDEAPRKLFARMGAFAGPVELEDIEAVAGGDGLDVLDVLARLVDVALVRRVESGDGRVRFGLPEALRQIAATTLDASPDAQRWRRAHAHREYDLAWAAGNLWVPAKAFRAAAAADAEADAALKWARRTDDPLAAGLGAARAMRLANDGHARQALEVLEPLLEEPSGEPAVDGLAWVAHALALFVVDQMDVALASAEQAVEIASDVATRALALSARGLIQGFRGERAASVRDSEQVTALARELDPAALAGALVFEAQARLFAGELDRAADQLAEAERVGAAVDATALWRVDTLMGDLAVLSGQPQDALEHYARSLEAAEARGDSLQVLFDLGGVANALAILNEDRAALEVAGLAEAHGEDVGRSAPHEVLGTRDRLDEVGDLAEEAGASYVSPLSRETAHDAIHANGVPAAQSRLGAALAGELRARGRAVRAGGRVTLACRLARARPAAATSRPTGSAAS